MTATQANLARSHALKARALELIPSATQTYSKAPFRFVQGVSPVFLERGRGCRVWDVDGNEFLDFTLALGPMILGYGDPDVQAAVEAQLADGPIFTLAHPLEIEVAERLVAIIPCAEMVRFGKNGSDATAGAVRVARAFTGRDVIACCGYHGWQDWFIGTTPRNAGVPEAVRALTRPFAYNDLAGLERVFDENRDRVAAVIMEPVMADPPRPGFLESVRDLAHEHGSLLIFDEVLTGFRVALAGAGAHFGVSPDLACFGKAMSNGFGISAVVGRRDVMRVFDEAFFSFTFAGDALALAASAATIDKLAREKVHEHLWSAGGRIIEGFNAARARLGLEGVVECAGLPPRSLVRFRTKDALLIESLFQQECHCRGVLFTGAHNMSLAHTGADVDRLLEVYGEVLGVVGEAVAAGDAASRLLGPPIQPVFRPRQEPA